MPTETVMESLLRARLAQESVAYIKMDDGDPRLWVGPGARLWVNNAENDCILDVALGSDPRREAIAHLRAAGFSIVEVVAVNLFVVVKT